MYRFGAFEIDLGLYALRKKRSAVDIQPKVLDLLIFLITHADRVVSKDEILEAVWSGVAATDDVLNRAVHAARHAVGDDGVKQRVIQTVRGRGFRFVAPIETIEPETSKPAPAESAGGLPFVGRSLALSQLHCALDQARQGHGRVVFVAGEAGIGKTRLLEEFTRDAPASGVRIAAGWCWEGDGAPPYWPWVQVLRALTQDSDAETLREQMGTGATDIARIMPRLQEKLPEFATDASVRSQQEPFQTFSHSDQERFKLFDSISRYLRQSASGETLIVVLDDLQWADRSSLRLIEFLVRELAGMQLLLVGAHHEQELSAGHPLLETIGALARHPTYERVFLDGLPEEETFQLLESIGGDRFSDELVSTVHAKTDGNPFLVTEIAQLVKADRRAIDADADGSAAISLPRGVKAIVQRKLAMVSPPVRRVLSLAAVAGQAFSRSMLERALGSEVHRDHLDEALGSNILREVSGAPGRYRFTHALIREALYDELDATQRARLHRRVADALVTMHGQGVTSESNVAAISFHFAEASNANATPEELEKAIAFARRAGEHASGQFAYEEASVYFQRALELIAHRETQTAAERCRLLIATANSERRAGNLAHAREILATAADLAREIKEPELLARAALDIETPFVWISGRVDSLEVSLLEDALSAIPGDQEQLRVKLLSRLALALYWSDDTKRPIQLAEQACENARRIGDPGLLATVQLEYEYATPPHISINIDQARENVRLADESGDGEIILLTNAAALEFSLAIGSAAGWETNFPAIVQIAEKLRQPTARWYAKSANASKLFIEGHISDADAIAEAARVLGERLGDPFIQFCAALQLYPLRREQKQLEACEDEFRVRSEQDRPGSLWTCSYAHLLFQLGRKDEARECFEALAADGFASLVVDDGWRVSMHLLTELCRDFRDLECAADLYRQLHPHEGLCAVLGFVALHGPFSRDLGILSAMLGDLEEAARHFEDAIETSRGLGAVTWEARVRYDHARALFEYGDSAQRDRALALAEQAQEAANRYELVALQADLDSLLQTR